jgi:hypothetical protein
VEARGSSHVVARGSSHVVAWESSHVEARGSSHVVAWESSHVEAWESSHVEAWGSSAVHNHSGYTTLELFGFSAAWLIAKASKVVRTGSNTTLIEPKQEKGTIAWLDREAVGLKDGKVVLFKRVSSEFKTQENTANETHWVIGTTVEHLAWQPEKAECGSGKFHACSRTYFCDEFRTGPGDRYVAIEIAMEDLFVWEGGSYPHKVAFRKGTVLYEVSRLGMKLEAKS